MTTPTEVAVAILQDHLPLTCGIRCGREMAASDEIAAYEGAAAAILAKVRPDDEPHPLDGKLEPESRDCGESSPLYSIAISLKRIADAICGDPQNSGIKHALFDLVDRPR